jgi:dTDP-4-amino-4,6-dideoxygalactose transaminase
MISFNVPPYLGKETEYIAQAIEKRKLSGDGEFTRRCSAWLEQNIGGTKALLTTSCTHALEMAALLCDIQPGDEVIMPSYTFVSTANAFVLRGAKIVFTDIRPDTMNIDEQLIEVAITKRTKAIVPVHYAGVACEMDEINAVAKKHGLFVIEDAAQAFASTYKGGSCGVLGDFGCFSFHETKNVSCGEGGALIIKNGEYVERAEILREKGTNRSKFFRGEIDKYSWVDQGSSYLPSELNAAYLLAQLELSNEILNNRMDNWNSYYDALAPLCKQGIIEIPHVPEECKHNGHMFYIKVKDINERTEIIDYLRKNGIYSVFHYIPLHSSKAGAVYSRFSSEDRYTTKESERLLRLPLYYGLTADERIHTVNAINAFYDTYN